MNDISTIEIGSRGEDHAMEWLRAQGFYIVERNWRIGHYEIDIIAQRFDTLHFVEVKTRKLGGWQSPYDSINDRKIAALRKGAMAYRTIHRTPLNIQFDLIAIVVDDHGHFSLEYTERIM
jgi:putative endonuclease